MHGVQLEFYATFKVKNVDFVCSLSSFENLKPWWAKQFRM